MGRPRIGRSRCREPSRPPSPASPSRSRCRSSQPANLLSNVTPVRTPHTHTHTHTRRKKGTWDGDAEPPLVGAGEEGELSARTPAHHDGAITAAVSRRRRRRRARWGGGHMDRLGHAHVTGRNRLGHRSWTVVTALGELGPSYLTRVWRGTRAYRCQSWWDPRSCRRG
jgi:hypothetical protein